VLVLLACISEMEIARHFRVLMAECKRAKPRPPFLILAHLDRLLGGDQDARTLMYGRAARVEYSPC
jgi:hypothetical protein